MAGSPFRKAWAASLVVHSVAAATLCVAWSAHSESRIMDVAALFVSDIDALPNSLPAVVATPLDEPSVEQPHAPIQPVSHQSSDVDDSPPPPATVLPSVASQLIRNIQQQSASKPKDPPSNASTTFFGVAAQGSSIVYVIDCSASMGLHGRLARAVQEVEASLQQLPPQFKYQIIAYHRIAEPLSAGTHKGMLSANPDSLRLAIAALSHLRAEGSANHRRALLSALALNSDVIYFLTDEDDFTITDANELTRINAGRTSIHTICLVNPQHSPSPLQQLARQNRGRFRVAE